MRHCVRISTLALFVALLGLTTSFLGVAQGLSESQRYVHTFVNVAPYGNWTFVDKPMFPVRFNQSQIPVGSNWTVISPLAANRSYHAYFYGEWVDYGFNPQTDYDIYVYNPLGELEGYHTESAGLPEHLGTTVEQPYFTPKYSGNYSFVIRNDPRESNASQPATFMIIENVECNKWQQAYVEGKQNNLPILNTSWAYDFVTESQRIEVWVKVPDSLDMYEARLYLMANPKAGKGELLNNVPIAWEPGLYGEVSQIYGGYNSDSIGFRGVAYASSEFYGKDMLINYTSPVKGKSLYHLVFIGEKGAGKIDFLVKTEFGKAQLNPVDPPLRMHPDDEGNLTFASSLTDLKNASLYYSVDNWKNSTSSNMQLIDNRTCHGVIPPQPAGTTVKYRVKAVDTLENVLLYNGSYPIKYDSHVNLTLGQKAVSIGDNITVTGLITPSYENVSITLTFTSINTTLRQTVTTLPDGSFKTSFKPSRGGTWFVQAVLPESSILYESSSPPLDFKVTPPSFLSQYATYIYAGVGAGIGIAALATFYVKKRRE